LDGRGGGFCNLGVLDLLGDKSASILAGGGLAKTLCGFCCWGISVRIGLGDGGGVGSYFPFTLRHMSDLASLYHGLMVGSYGSFPTFISSFYFPLRYLFLLFFLGLHLGYGYGGKESALLGSLVVWRLCLCAVSLFGGWLMGFGRQSMGNSGAGVQACCCLGAGVSYDLLSVCRVCGITWVVFRLSGFLALALALVVAFVCQDTV